MGINQLSNKKAPRWMKSLHTSKRKLAWKIMTALCQQIWKKATWPKDWKRTISASKFLKKGEITEHFNYRTTSFMHVLTRYY